MKTSLILLLLLFTLVDLKKSKRKKESKGTKETKERKSSKSSKISKSSKSSKSSFVDQIKDNGVYDLLKDIKHTFGSDVSIQTCLNIYKKDDCKKVVLNNIPNKEGFKIPYIKTKLDGIVNTMTLSNLFANNIDKFKIEVDTGKIIKDLKSKFPLLFGLQ